MSVTISTAMASVAASQAAIAAAEAARAHKERCKATMPNFDAQKAGVSEMQEYADCVNVLYPQEVGADMTIVIKVLFVTALAGLISGAWYGHKDGFLDSVILGIVGFFMLPCIAVFIGGILYGIWWLFV